MWLELLKHSDISVLYHPDKANVFADALNQISVGSFAHVPYGKKELVKELHRLNKLGLRFEYSTKRGSMVHKNFK